MPFDGFFAKAAANELNGIAGARIEKVNHFAGDYVTFDIYTQNHKKEMLVISASPSDAGVYLAPRGDDRPMQPTMLCMLMRKHLQGARILSVNAPDNERIVKFELERGDELGHDEKKYIYAEIMGKFSNMIICDGEEKILGALHTSDITSKTRAVLSGIKYELPPAQNKIDIKKIDKAGFIRLAGENIGKKIADFILHNFLCFSPLITREIAARTAGDIDKTVEKDNILRLTDVFFEFCEMIKSEKFSPVMIVNPDGGFVDYTFCEIKMYGESYKNITYPDFSSLQNDFWSKKSQDNKKKSYSRDISKLLQTVKSRTEKKLVLQKEELAECERADECKNQGDLITSNIYRLKRGDGEVMLYDYETEKEVKITLDKRLSPSQNAAARYKKYNKYKNARAVLTKQIENDEKELLYISTVEDALERASCERDFEEIRTEIVLSGLAGRNKNDKSGGKNKKTVRQKPSVYKLESGLRVRVGRNNIQNDELTFSSDKNDIWFHVKSFPGSHTVLECRGTEPDDGDILTCARLAAFNSKAGGSGKVAVDYTKIRYVKKPSGARPGFVTYDRFKTAVVDASEPENIKDITVR